MNETRAGKLGRNLAVWVIYTINHQPKSERAEYRTRFYRELRKYSFEPRKRGEPRNSGCVHELDGIDEINPECPEELAKWVKEFLHMQYQKQTSYKTYRGFVNRFLRRIRH